MTTIRRLVALVVAVLTMGSASPTWAQAKPSAKDPKKPSESKKVLKLEELKVEGRIQKPQAMFLMPRANLNVGELDHAEPFLPKVTKAVDKDPF
jgi:hypothetical protein